MKRLSKLFATFLGIFVFTFGIGLSMPEPADATHCHSEWSCGCAGSSIRAFEKVICDGQVVSTKCYNLTC